MMDMMSFKIGTNNIVTGLLYLIALKLQVLNQVAQYRFWLERLLVFTILKVAFTLDG